jgi:hypothetical protein
MKIALCLHGNVGMLYTNKRNYKWNQFVDYRIGYEHYKKHLLDINDNVDVFIHSWSTEFEKGIVETYKPKSFLFEKQKVFGAKWSDETGATRKEYTFSRWYSAKESMRLKKEYEQKNNFEYDIVISTRFDLLFLMDINFSLFENTSYLYVPLNKNYMKHNPRILDYFFFSNSTNMDKYIGGLYDWLLPRLEITDQSGKTDSHTDSMVFAKECNLEVVMAEDYKEPETIIIARALYDDCQFRGDNYPGVDNLKVLNNYPRGQFGTRF